MSKHSIILLLLLRVLWFSLLKLNADGCRPPGQKPPGGFNTSQGTGSAAPEVEAHLGLGRGWRAWLAVGSACPCLRARSASCSPCQWPGMTGVQSGPGPERTQAATCSPLPRALLGGPWAPSEAGPMVSGPPCQGWDSALQSPGHCGCQLREAMSVLPPDPCPRVVLW